jgi:hypothetical protein
MFGLLNVAYAKLKAPNLNLIGFGAFSVICSCEFGSNKLV